MQAEQAHVSPALGLTFFILFPKLALLDQAGKSLADPLAFPLILEASGDGACLQLELAIITAKAALVGGDVERAEPDIFVGAFHVALSRGGSHQVHPSSRPACRACSIGMLAVMSSILVKYPLLTDRSA
jgi:hypothetical protein